MPSPETKINNSGSMFHKFIAEAYISNISVFSFGIAKSVKRRKERRK
jgi:hypothetical protein